MPQIVCTDTQEDITEPCRTLSRSSNWNNNYQKSKLELNEVQCPKNFTFCLL